MKLATWKTVRLGTLSAFAISITLATSPSVATVASCDLEKTMTGRWFSQKFNAAPALPWFLDTKGDFRNGEVIAFSKDDRVVVAELTLVVQETLLLPSQLVRFNSGTFFPHNYSVLPDTGLDLTHPVVGNDGRTYRFSHFQGDNLLFIVRDDGVICDKMLSGDTLAGRVTETPEGAQWQERMADKPVFSGGFRVVFTGIADGTMSFQELWTNGSTIVKSIKRTFDQSATKVEIGPATLEIVGNGDGKIQVKTTVPDRMPVPFKKVFGYRELMRPVKMK